MDTSKLNDYNLKCYTDYSVRMMCSGLVTGLSLAHDIDNDNNRDLCDTVDTKCDSLYNNLLDLSLRYIFYRVFGDKYLCKYKRFLELELSCLRSLDNTLSGNNIHTEVK